MFLFKRLTAHAAHPGELSVGFSGLLMDRGRCSFILLLLAIALLAQGGSARHFLRIARSLDVGLDACCLLRRSVIANITFHGVCGVWCDPGVSSVTLLYIARASRFVCGRGTHVGVTALQMPHHPKFRWSDPRILYCKEAYARYNLYIRA